MRVLGKMIALSLLAIVPVVGGAIPAGAAVLEGGLEPFAGEAGRIRISGGTAHIPVMRRAAARIMRFNPDIRISVAGGGSGAGIKQVGEGLVDIGNSGRRPTEAEVLKYGLTVFEIAVDGIGVIVNAENSVKELSSSQLKAIYSGEITDWGELGGRKGPITVYTRDNSSGTREVFRDKGLQRGPITERAHFAVSNGAMKAAVSQDPNGIGYVSAGFIDDSVSPVVLDGVSPDIDSIREGRYVISRKLYCNTRGEPRGLSRKLIDYLLSPEGRKIIEEEGFIPNQ